MKKILASAAILLLSISAFAKNVSRADAQAVAQKHFGGSAVATYVWGDETTKASGDAPAYFVFNNPAGGWVIVSGEDVTSPILGYSKTGSFKTEGMPSNVSGWFDKIRADISRARKAGAVQSAQARAKWQSVGAVTKADGGKLLKTAEWDQLAPYNDSCKVACKGKAVCTGCVATAMAIVVRYNEWPAQGVGTVPSYRTYTNNYSIPARNMAHSFNYSNMPLTDGSTTTWTTAEKQAVAQLMLDCGAMVQMDYDVEGSGAYSTDVAQALSKYMCYAPTAHETIRSLYSNNEWLGLLKEEINAGYPIIYGGSSGDDGGHQFVIDGYDTDNNVHVNWGWGGYDNGYFPVCYLELDDYVFSDYDAAILGLRKGTAGSSSDTKTAEILLGSYPELASGSIAKGSTFSISSLNFINTSYYVSYKGKIKAALCDKNGTVKEYIGESSITIDQVDEYDTEYPSDDITSLSCSITKDIALGDKIGFFYQLSDGSWALTGNMSSAAPYSYIPVADSYKAGETYYFDVALQLKEPEDITWYVNGTKTYEEYMTLKSGITTIKAVVEFSDGTKETITQKIKVD